MPEAQHNVSAGFLNHAVVVLGEDTALENRSGFLFSGFRIFLSEQNREDICRVVFVGQRLVETIRHVRPYVIAHYSAEGVS